MAEKKDLQYFISELNSRIQNDTLTDSEASSLATHLVSLLNINQFHSDSDADLVLVFHPEKGCPYFILKASPQFKFRNAVFCLLDCFFKIIRRLDSLSFNLSVTLLNLSSNILFNYLDRRLKNISKNIIISILPKLGRIPDSFSSDRVIMVVTSDCATKLPINEMILNLNVLKCLHGRVNLSKEVKNKILRLHVDILEQEISSKEDVKRDSGLSVIDKIDPSITLIFKDLDSFFNLSNSSLIGYNDLRRKMYNLFKKLVPPPKYNSNSYLSILSSFESFLVVAIDFIVNDCKWWNSLIYDQISNSVFKIGRKKVLDGFYSKVANYFVSSASDISKLKPYILYFESFFITELEKQLKLPVESLDHVRGLTYFLPAFRRLLRSNEYNDYVKKVIKYLLPLISYYTECGAQDGIDVLLDSTLIIKQGSIGSKLDEDLFQHSSRKLFIKAFLIYPKYCFKDQLKQSIIDFLQEAADDPCCLNSFIYEILNLQLKNDDVEIECSAEEYFSLWTVLLSPSSNERPGSKSKISKSSFLGVILQRVVDLTCSLNMNVVKNSLINSDGIEFCNTHDYLVLYNIGSLLSMIKHTLPTNPSATLETLKFFITFTEKNNMLSINYDIVSILLESTCLELSTYECLVKMPIIEFTRSLLTNICYFKGKLFTAASRVLMRLPFSCLDMFSSDLVSFTSGALLLGIARDDIIQEIVLGFLRWYCGTCKPNIQPLKEIAPFLIPYITSNIQVESSFITSKKLSDHIYYLFFKADPDLLNSLISSGADIFEFYFGFTVNEIHVNLQFGSLELDVEIGKSLQLAVKQLVSEFDANLRCDLCKSLSFLVRYLLCKCLAEEDERTTRTLIGLLKVVMIFAIAKDSPVSKEVGHILPQISQTLSKSSHESILVKSYFNFLLEGLSHHVLADMRHYSLYCLNEFLTGSASLPSDYLKLSQFSIQSLFGEISLRSLFKKKLAAAEVLVCNSILRLMASDESLLKLYAFPLLLHLIKVQKNSFWCPEMVETVEDTVGNIMKLNKELLCSNESEYIHFLKYLLTLCSEASPENKIHIMKIFLSLAAVENNFDEIWQNHFKTAYERPIELEFHTNFHFSPLIDDLEQIYSVFRIYNLMLSSNISGRFSIFSKQYVLNFVRFFNSVSNENLLVPMNPSLNSDPEYHFKSSRSITLINEAMIEAVGILTHAIEDNGMSEAGVELVDFLLLSIFKPSQYNLYLSTDIYQRMNSLIKRLITASQKVSYHFWKVVPGMNWLEKLSVSMEFLLEELPKVLHGVCEPSANHFNAILSIECFKHIDMGIESPSDRLNLDSYRLKLGELLMSVEGGGHYSAVTHSFLSFIFEYLSDDHSQMWTSSLSKGLACSTEGKSDLFSHIKMCLALLFEFLPESAIQKCVDKLCCQSDFRSIKFLLGDFVFKPVNQILRKEIAERIIHNFRTDFPSNSENITDALLIIYLISELEPAQSFSLFSEPTLCAALKDIFRSESSDSQLMLSFKMFPLLVKSDCLLPVFETMSLKYLVGGRVSPLLIHSLWNSIARIYSLTADPKLFSILFSNTPNQSYIINMVKAAFVSIMSKLSVEEQAEILKSFIELLIEKGVSKESFAVLKEFIDLCFKFTSMQAINTCLIDSVPLIVKKLQGMGSDNLTSEIAVSSFSGIIYLTYKLVESIDFDFVQQVEEKYKNCLEFPKGAFAQLIFVVYNLFKKYSNVTAVDEMIRNLMCTTYNALLALLSKSRKDLDAYNHFLFSEDPEKGKFIWKHLCRPAPYKFSDHMKRPEKMHSVSFSIDFSLLVWSQDSLVSQDSPLECNLFDMLKVKSGDLVKVELDNDIVNRHACMQPLCALVGYMFHSEITPKPSDSLSNIPPAWMKRLRKSLVAKITPKSAKTFLLKVIFNCRDLFKPYAEYWICCLMKLVSKTHCCGVSMNYFMYDVSKMILDWHSQLPAESQSIESVFANNFFLFFLNMAAKKTKHFLYVQEMMREIVNNMTDSLCVPYEKLLSLINSTESQEIRTGLEASIMFLNCNREPYEPSNKMNFLHLIQGLLKSSIKIVFFSACSLAGLVMKKTILINETAHNLLLASEEQFIKDVNKYFHQLSKKDTSLFLNGLFKIKFYYENIILEFSGIFLEILDNHMMIKLHPRVLELMKDFVQLNEGLSVLAKLEEKGLMDQILRATSKTKIAILGTMSELIKKSPFSIHRFLKYVYDLTKDADDNVRILVFEILILLSKNSGCFMGDMEGELKHIKSLIACGLFDKNPNLVEKVFQYLIVEELPQHLDESILYLFTHLKSPKDESLFIQTISSVLIAQFKPDSPSKLFKESQFKRSFSVFKEQLAIKPLVTNLIPRVTGNFDNAEVISISSDSETSLGGRNDLQYHSMSLSQHSQTAFIPSQSLEIIPMQQASTSGKDHVISQSLSDVVYVSSGSEESKSQAATVINLSTIKVEDHFPILSINSKDYFDLFKNTSILVKGLSDFFIRSLINSLKETLAFDDLENFRSTITIQIGDIFTSTKQCNINLFELLLNIIRDLDLTVDSFAAELVIISREVNLEALALVILENSFLCRDEHLITEPPTKRRRIEIEDRFFLMFFLSKHIGCKEATIEFTKKCDKRIELAFKAESASRYDIAVTHYKDMLASGSYFCDLIIQCVVECYSYLSDWGKIKSEIKQLITAGKVIAMPHVYLLTQLLNSEIMVWDQPAHSLQSDFILFASKLEALDRKFCPGLSILSVIGEDKDSSEKMLHKLHQNVIGTKNNCLERCSLQVVMIDLILFSNLNSSDWNDLLTYWSNNISHEYFHKKNLHQWEKIINFRMLLMNFQSKIAPGSNCDRAAADCKKMMLLSLCKGFLSINHFHASKKYLLKLSSSLDKVVLDLLQIELQLLKFQYEDGSAKKLDSLSTCFSPLKRILKQDLSTSQVFSVAASWVSSLIQLLNEDRSVLSEKEILDFTIFLKVSMSPFNNFILDLKMVKMRYLFQTAVYSSRNQEYKSLVEFIIQENLLTTENKDNLLETEKMLLKSIVKLTPENFNFFVLIFILKTVFLENKLLFINAFEQICYSSYYYWLPYLLFICFDINIFKDLHPLILTSIEKYPSIFKIPFNICKNHICQELIIGDVLHYSATECDFLKCLTYLFHPSSLLLFYIEAIRKSLDETEKTLKLFRDSTRCFFDIKLHGSLFKINDVHRPAFELVRGLYSAGRQEEVDTKLCELKSNIKSSLSLPETVDIACLAPSLDKKLLDLDLKFPVGSFSGRTKFIKLQRIMPKVEILPQHPCASLVSVLDNEGHQYNWFLQCCSDSKKRTLRENTLLKIPDPLYGLSEFKWFGPGVIPISDNVIIIPFPQ